MHENSNILSLTKEIDDPNAGSGQYIDVINLCNGHRGSLGGTQFFFCFFGGTPKFFCSFSGTQ